MHSEAIRGNQRKSEAIRGQSAVIRGGLVRGSGHQRSSAVIRGGLVRGGGYTSLKMEWRERLDRWTRAMPWGLRRPLAVHAIDA